MLKLCGFWIIPIVSTIWIEIVVEISGKHTDTMMGEHLNPADSERGEIMIFANLSGNFDDGTNHDMRKQRKNNMRADTDGQLWPNRKIPYMISDDFDEDDRSVIARTLDIFTKYTCIRVVPRSDESDYIVIKRSADGITCRSSLGNQGGKQTLLLAERCLSQPGSTVHEFMHTIGFWHEQTREDRDKYIEVNYDNIIKGYKAQFDKEESTRTRNMVSAYDYLSILHYTNHADSKNGEATMRRRSGKEKKLGQRENLTELDIEKINKLYKCDVMNLRTQPDETEAKSQTRKNQQQASICRDLDSLSCRSWARRGYCSKTLGSKIFMSVFCRKSCKLCKNYSVCLDMRPLECPSWAGKNYCQKFSEYMMIYCAKSCRTECK